MAVDTTTRIRADDLRLSVDLGGLSLFLSNLIYDAELDQLPLIGIDKDDLTVEARTSDLSSDELYSALWTGVDDDDPEYTRASARSGLLAAQLFAFVASDEGRRVCEKWADHLLRIEMKQLRKADDA